VVSAVRPAEETRVSGECSLSTGGRASSRTRRAASPLHLREVMLEVIDEVDHEQLQRYGHLA
jgi:hypothetical protein